jgi:hypothetical protein
MGIAAGGKVIMSEYKEPTECPLFNDDVKKQLIGLLPFDEDATENYTPSSFDKVPEEFQPVFVIRPLKQLERERMSLYINKLSSMEETADTKQKEIVELNDKMNDIVRQCVVGMRNLYDLGNQKLIDFEADENGGLSKSIWRRIPEAVKTNIYYRVNGISGLFYSESVALRS